MTPDERLALDALKTFARLVRAYNALVDRGVSFSSQEYIRAANEMEAAERALIDAAQPMIEGEPARDRTP